MPVNTDQTDPQGPNSGSYRVFRGGCSDSYADRCRSALRGVCEPNFRYDALGFRVVLELSEEEFMRYAKQYRPD